MDASSFQCALSRVSSSLIYQAGQQQREQYQKYAYFKLGVIKIQRQGEIDNWNASKAKFFFVFSHVVVV